MAMIGKRVLLAGASAALIWSCEPQGGGAVLLPAQPCGNPAVVLPSGILPTPHKFPKQVMGKDTSLSATQWARGDSVRAFFGNKEIKLVFVLEKILYLLTYSGDTPVLTRLSQNDEGIYGSQGSINSPLLSPDGRKIVFAGTLRGKPGFILDAVTGGTPAWRVPLDAKAHTTADPHWSIENGKTYIYFASAAGLVDYSEDCFEITGSTYRKEVLGDTVLDSTRATGIPGAYRGGISRDGIWAGTSYASSALYNRSTEETRLLAGGAQQCNPSMNPYPPGSVHSDYMMILAFGGKPAYKIIDGTEFLEGLHENLWIYNKDDKVVWQAKRPDSLYLRFDKPEWSTHPDYATAILLRKDNGDGDLFVIRIGDLANAEEGALNQAREYLRIGKGGFTSDTFSHLWVGP